MRTLTLQKNRLLLAGLLAFAVLFFTQITVLAYDYGGGWSVVKNVGGAGVQWLNVGNPLVDADVNAGQMPTLVTLSASDIGAVLGVPQATLNANVSNMGAVDNTYVSFQWGYDATYGNNTTEVLQSTTGLFSSIISGYDGTRLVHYRVQSRTDSVYIYGLDQIVPLSSTQNTTINLAKPILGLAILIILVLVLIGFLFGDDDIQEKIKWIIIFGSLTIILFMIVMLILNSVTS